jgi:type II secretory pathway component GspD/PulD (secretin)
MKTRFALTTLLLASGTGSLAQGQVVQLPTYGSFSIGTTVVVPDRGATYLGGVNRAYYGYDSFGVPGLSRIPVAGRLFRNDGYGASVSSSGAFATARIIDLQEWDAAVLKAAARQRGAGTADTALERKAAFLTQHVGRSIPARGGDAPALRLAGSRPDGKAAGNREAVAHRAYAASR